MIFDITYDIVLPIGAGCPAALTLSHHSMRFCSYPFDWLKVGSIDSQARILTSRFNNFFNLDDLRIHATEINEQHLVVENTKWGYLSYHDFPKDCEISVSYADIANKYKRRCSRLLSQLNAGQKVLLLWIDYPLEQNELTAQQCLDALSQIQQAYPNSTFSLLYIHNDESRWYDNRLEKHISSHVCQVSLAYGAHRTAIPWLTNYESLAFLLGRIQLSTANKNKETLKRYIARKRNTGSSEQKYLKRQRFAADFASLILRKKIVWRIAKCIYELMKH